MTVSRVVAGNPFFGLSAALLTTAGLWLLGAPLGDRLAEPFYILLAGAPLAAAVAGLLVNPPAKAALLYGAIGALGTWISSVPPAAEASDRAYEPLLTPAAVALLWAIICYLPVPFLSLGLWAWRLARAPD